MLRCTLYIRCSKCVQHIPSHARVGIFPLHLDPPTIQHRELFRLLLGQNAHSNNGSSKNNNNIINNNNNNNNNNSNSSVVSGNGGGSVSSKFWYMSDIAEGLRADSQLAPLDELIIIPNTRYSISLRQSTHLATLAVLGTRGLPHVHVDFTALEHPDDNMPVVYDLTQKFPNAVLVHWLHDAYEMQRWKNFQEMKMRVPLLLLQTNSVPVSVLAKPAPKHAASAASRLQSRQYHNPDLEIAQAAGPSSVEYYTQIWKRLHDDSQSSASEIVGASTSDVDSAVRGAWWLTKGGRGDDLVEVSRSYVNAASSSWLGGPTRVSPPPHGSAAASSPSSTTTNNNGNGVPSGDVVVSDDGTVKLFTNDGESRLASAASSGNRDVKQNDPNGADSIHSCREVFNEFLDVQTELEYMLESHYPTGDGQANSSSQRPNNNNLAESKHGNKSGRTPSGRGAGGGSTTANPYGGRCVRVLLEELYGTMDVNGNSNSNNEPGNGESHKDANSASNHSNMSLSGVDERGDNITDVEREFFRILKEPKSEGHDNTVDDAFQSSSSSSAAATTVAAVSREQNDKVPSAILFPLVEVHPVSRTTGADVRQALWEQDLSPSHLLPSGALRYVESHGLYRDSRKNASVAGGNSRFVAVQGGSYHSAAYGNMSSSSSNTNSSSSSSALKRAATQRESATMTFPGVIPRLELHYDRNNLLAREQYGKLKMFQCADNEAPDLIVPIGGDGYMMHCIRNNWRRFIPFYGVNAGHVGYLLNDCATLEELFTSPLKLHTSNMLYCQAERETETGERVLLSELAFNDAWVERSSGQTALIRISVNGEERIRRLRGDGVLVSTAAGSTAYSQALGASPVPVGVPLIQVVGSNVVSPAQWRPAHLDQEDQVELEVVDSVKRPCRCFVDSVNVGNVARMLVRSSRVAGVTLAFSRSCDLQHKLYQVQFPKAL